MIITLYGLQSCKKGHVNSKEVMWEDGRAMQSSSASSVVSTLGLLNCFGHGPVLKLSLI